MLISDYMISRVGMYEYYRTCNAELVSGMFVPIFVSIIITFADQ